MISNNLFYAGNKTKYPVKIAAASYQLIISGLKCAAWMPDNREDRETIRRACHLIEDLRDKQKQIESGRK